MGIMEATKRTYQKHKTEKKITVKHFVNTNVTITGMHKDEKTNPIYVEVIYNRQTTRFKSHIRPSKVFLEDDRFWDYTNFNIPISEFPDDLIDHVNFLRECLEVAIKREEITIRRIINEQVIIKSDKFNLHNFSKIYHSKYYTLSSFVKIALQSEIQQSIQKIIPIEITSFDASIFVDINYSPLEHLEFFKRVNPILGKQLSSPKLDYPSDIWLFDMFLSMMNNVYREYSYGDYKVYNVYGEYNLMPTIYDYQEGYFEEMFLMYIDRSINLETIKNILKDVQRLFDKYYDSFKMLNAEDVINK